jgi:hypothetical protein
VWFISDIGGNINQPDIGRDIGDAVDPRWRGERGRITKFLSLTFWMRRRRRRRRRKRNELRWRIT